MTTDEVEIRGVIVDRDGRPIEGAEVRATASSDASPIDETRSDGGGSFTLRAPAGRVVFVFSEPEGYAPGVVRVLAPASDVRIELTAEAVVVGQVVERATGAPVRDVEVWVDRSFWPNDAGRASGRTDDEGRFRIGGLPPGRYEPKVDSPPWRGAGTSVPLSYRETSPETRIEVTRAVTVRGRLLLPEPLRKPGRARLVNEHDDRHTGTVFEEGDFEIAGVEPGEWTLEVDAAPFVEDERRTLSVGRGDLEGIEVPVRRGGRVFGVVVDESGRAIDGAEILLWHRTLKRKRTANEAGMFAFGGLREGQYRLEATAPDRAFERGELPVDVTFDAPTQQIRIELSARATLRGRIVDTRGAPVDRSEITLIHFDEGEEFHSCGDFLGAADGHFLFEDLEPRTYTLVPERYGLGELRAPDGGSARRDVVVEPGADLEVEVVVEQLDRAIEGRIVDANAKPFPSVLVAVARESEDAEEYGNALFLARHDESWAVVTDDEGRFRIGQLGDGTYTVVAHRPDGAELSTSGVFPGQRVTMMLEPSGSVAGRLTAPDGAPVESFELKAESRRFSREEAIFAPDGAFSLDGLSRGKWTIRIFSDIGRAEIEVMVRPGEVTDAGSLSLLPAEGPTAVPPPPG